MSRSSILILLSSLALTTVACGSGQQQPAEGPVVATPARDPKAAPGSRATETDTGEAGEDMCAHQQPTGDPPACPSGCIWEESKQRCAPLRGVIVPQRPR